MTPCLVDVNVWLALLARNHTHHERAITWFDRCSAREAGLCRLAQLALVRHLGSRTIMGEYAVPASVAWATLTEILADERGEFLAEPPGLDHHLPALLRYAIPTPKLINDAYLAAFAIASNRTLVTIDKGFRQFAGLRVQLLTA